MRSPYTVPQEPGRWRAIILATVVHAALLGLLWFGVRWQNETPTAVEAEVWDMKTREAAPLPKPEPEPEPETPPPVEKPVLRPPPPPVRAEVEKPVEKPVERPDIALAQEKKRKAEQLRKAEEERQKTEAKKLVAQREAEQQRIRQARAEQAEAQAKTKREAEAAQRKAEEAKLAQKQAAEQAEKKKLAEQKQAAEKTEKKKLAEQKRAQEVADQQLRDKARQQEMARLSAAIGSGGSGEAAKSTGNNRADASYVAKISSLIRSNTVFVGGGNVDGNPTVEYIVDLLPDGSVRSVRKTKPSGLSGFDEAVLDGIRAAAPYPKDKSGTVPSSMRVPYKLKEL